eukprot:3395493-Pleurochrysis_carterae.AAC.1
MRLPFHPSLPACLHALTLAALRVQALRPASFAPRYLRSYALLPGLLEYGRILVSVYVRSSVRNSRVRACGRAGAGRGQTTTTARLRRRRYFLLCFALNLLRNA